MPVLRLYFSVEIMALLAWEPAAMIHESDLRRPELPGDEIATRPKTLTRAPGETPGDS